MAKMHRWLVVLSTFLVAAAERDRRRRDARSPRLGR